MSIFLITFAFMLIVVFIMAVGVIFGRQAIKGSCGGANKGSCICIKKCAAKRLRMEAESKV